MLAGRKIVLIDLRLQENKLIIQETVEEYFVYKNIVPEQIAFNDQFVMIAGYRFVDDGIKGEILNDTYDHSGIFIYNRLGRPGGSPWVRQLISKDDIFYQISSNSYKAVLDGNKVVVQGGYTPFVVIYEISNYQIECSHHLILVEGLSKSQIQEIMIDMIGAEGPISLPLSKLVYGPDDQDKDDKPQPSDKSTEEKKSSRIPTYIAVIVVILILFVLLLLYSRNSQRGNKTRYRDVADLTSVEEDSMVNAPDSLINESSILSDTKTRQKKDD